jgi:hypothetical protein
MPYSRAAHWLRLARGCACYCLVFLLPLSWTTELLPVAWEWAAGYEGRDG